MLHIRSLEEADVAGKRVLLHASLDLPLLASGAVGDTYRLVRGLKTLEYLVAQGAKVILLGHLGRDGASLAPVCEALQKLAPHIKISFADTLLENASGAVEQLGAGECLMLENIRQNPGEEKNDPGLASLLASLADVFVDDSFADAHRAYASNVGVAGLLPSCAGFLMLEEVARLTEALEPPPGALAIVGGAKFETKEPLISKLLLRYAKVLLGGALADDVLVSRGVPIGRSLVSGFVIPESISQNERLVLPTDMVAVDADTKARRVASVHGLGEREDGVDIGTKTSTSWAGEIARAPFVLWNGPMGMYENGFADGTNTLAKAVCEGSCRAVIGGGDTAASLAQFSFDRERVFISTGGGAMLEFLANGTLPALEALKNQALS